MSDTSQPPDHPATRPTVEGNFQTYEGNLGVDDELVATVRIRFATPDVRDRIASAVLDFLPGRLHEAVADLLDPGSVDLAGIEIALPDFRPYNAAGKITHEFTDAEKPSP